MLLINEKTKLNAPSEKLLLTVEKYYRIIFPKNYKLFLKNWNGAVPITNTFVFDGHEYLIENFLSLLGDGTEKRWDDIEVIITEIGSRLSNDENQIGKKIIPIASLFAGDFVCLDFRNGLENPSICIWYHEQSAPFRAVTKKIANSFDEFLNMLK